MAAQALGWSPFDDRLLALSVPQMEWAIVMADPDRRGTFSDAKATERDSKAVMLLEWYRKHISGGGS